MVKNLKLKCEKLSSSPYVWRIQLDTVALSPRVDKLKALLDRYFSPEKTRENPLWSFQALVSTTLLTTAYILMDPLFPLLGQAVNERRDRAPLFLIYSAIDTAGLSFPTHFPGVFFQQLGVVHQFTLLSKNLGRRRTSKC